MFQSLYFKQKADEIAAQCCVERYKDSGVNDQTIGYMFYLKQLAKAATDRYEAHRAHVDTKGAVDRKIVASDKFFSVQSSTRAGAAKLDRELVLSEMSRLIQATAAAAGAELSDIEARNQAATALERCTTYSKDSVVIAVVENGNV